MEKEIDGKTERKTERERGGGWSPLSSLCVEVMSRFVKSVSDNFICCAVFTDHTALEREAISSVCIP